MKTLKRTLCLLICMTLTLPIIPALSVFAETHSGTCGDNVTWEFDSDTGLLTIDGIGNMENYSDDAAPWYSYRGEITSVIINDGVTGIGNCSFFNCTALTSVVIPESVTTIGGMVFYSCTGLTSVTMPDSVISIDSNTFYGCTGLAGFTLPQRLEYLGSNVFEGCTGLVNIAIPDSVTYMGMFVFKCCTELTSITIGSGIKSISSYAFYECSKLANVTMGDNVTSIGNFAFHRCYSLAEITIPDSVTSIGYNAFSSCSSLASIVIPAGVTSLGEAAFKDCTSLSKVTINDGERKNAENYSYFDCSVLTRIGKQAFYGCYSLASINIPSSVTGIGASAFNGCYSLADVYITDWDAWFDITFSNYLTDRTVDPLIYAHNLYINGELAEELIIPEGVEEIRNYAFYSLECIQSVIIPSSVTTIGNYAFCYCTSLKNIDIPDSVTTIGEYAFYRCTALESVNISDSVTTIESYAFANCTSLKNITIPGSVTDINAYTFKECTSLTDATFLNGVEKIIANAFLDCTSLAKVFIPNSIVSIYNMAFYHCDEITDVYFEGSAQEAEFINEGSGVVNISNATWHYNCDINSSDALSGPIVHNIIHISASGGQGITYDAEENSCSESEFELNVNVNGLYLTGASEEERAMKNAVVTIILPAGFSFYEDESIVARRYEFDSLYSVPKITDTIYIQNPRSGDFTVTIRASAENVVSKTYKYTISIETSVFELNKYRAEWFFESSERTAAENYFFGDTPSKTIYKMGQENGLGTATAAWSAFMDTLNVADSPSSLIDYTFEEKDIYEAIIMDLFECSVDYSVTSILTSGITKETTSLVSTAAKEMKTLYNIDVYDSFFEDLSDVQKDYLAEVIGNTYQDFYPTSALVSDIAGYIKTAAGYVGDFQTLCENVTAYNNIRRLTGSMKQIMRDMYNNCPSDNPALKVALLDCIAIMNTSELDFAADMATLSGSVVGKDIVEYCIDEFWGDVKKTFCAAHPAAFTFMAAYIGGKTIANTFFNANSIEEEYCKIAAINEVWDLAESVYIKERNSFSDEDTDETAQIYNRVIDVVFNMLDTDCEYALSYADAVDDAWAQKIFDAFGDTTINDFKSNIEVIQNSYNNAHKSELINWIWSLKSDFPSRFDDYEYLAEMSVSDITKKLNINCPVDVYVLNKNGSILGYVKDNVPYYVEGAEITIGVSGDSKTIYLYDDEYVIRYIGNDEGSMDITVTEYDSSGDEARTVYFYDIALSDGLIYTSVEDGETLVSDSYYLMDEDGEEILPDYDSLDANSDAAYTASITRGYFTKSVEVETELNAGDKAEIAAYIPEGYKFIGWTSDAGEDIFADAESVTTTITMPNCDVNITAEVEETATLKIASAENGVIEVQALNCEEITSGTIYISVYNADGVHKATVTAPWAESVSVSEMEFESGDIIKAFLWNENMQPQIAAAQRLAS